MYEPSLCMVAQGAKRVRLGDDTYVYDAQNYLITSVHLPTVVQVTEASLEKPYLGLRLTFDLRELAQLMADSRLPATRSQQIARAIEWLKGNFTRPLRIDDLAEKARMSPSTFHHYFRSMTALSPIQYQKQLRLQEARRLMLAERLDAANAAFQVGYESPSQFSREYSRMFGAPPLRDIQQLRQVAAN